MSHSIALVHKKWRCEVSKNIFTLKKDDVNILDNTEEFEELVEALKEYRKLEGGVIKSCLHISDPEKDMQVVVKKAELDGFLRFIQEIATLLESNPSCLCEG